MSLIKFRRKPWKNLMASDFFDEDHLFFNGLLSRDLNEPALNVKETETHFEVELAAPGYSKKDFEVSIEDGHLNIAAERSSSKKEKEDNYSRHEFSYDAFKKRLGLPESVEEEDIQASYSDGILKFTLSKKEDTKQRKPKMIEIT